MFRCGCSIHVTLFRFAASANIYNNSMRSIASQLASVSVSWRSSAELSSMCVRPRVSRGSMLGLSLPSLAAQRDLRVRVRVLAGLRLVVASEIRRSWRHCPARNSKRILNASLGCPSSLAPRCVAFRSSRRGCRRAAPIWGYRCTPRIVHIDTALADVLVELLFAFAQMQNAKNEATT